MLVIRAGIHKMLVRANREDPDQTVDLGGGGGGCTVCLGIFGRQLV